MATQLDLSKLYTKTRMSRILSLKPSHLTTDYETHIQDILNKYEGKCNAEGYVEKGSICNLEKGRMFTEPDRFHGNVRIPITFTANVCYPTRNDIIECQVENVNQFGIMAMAGPLNVVVIQPKNLDISVGDIISVKVIHAKFHVDEAQINIYGKISSSEDDTDEKEIQEENTTSDQKGGDTDESVREDKSDEESSSDEEDDSDIENDDGESLSESDGDDGGYLSGNEYTKDEAYDEGDNDESSESEEEEKEEDESDSDDSE